MHYATRWIVDAGIVERYFYENDPKTNKKQTLFRAQVHGFVGSTNQLTLLLRVIDVTIRDNAEYFLDTTDKQGRVHFTLMGTSGTDGISVLVEPAPTNHDKILDPNTAFDKPSPLPIPEEPEVVPDDTFDRAEVENAYKTKNRTPEQDDLLVRYEDWLRKNKYPVTGRWVVLPPDKRQGGRRVHRKTNKRNPNPHPTRDVPFDLSTIPGYVLPQKPKEDLTEAKEPTPPTRPTPRKGDGWHGLDVDHIFNMIDNGNAAAEVFIRGNVISAYNVPTKERSTEDQELIQKYEDFLRRKGKKPTGGWVPLRSGITREDAVRQTAKTHQNVRKAIEAMDQRARKGTRRKGDLPKHLIERAKKELDGDYDSSVVDRLLENTLKNPEGDPEVLDERDKYTDDENAENEEK